MPRNSASTTRPAFEACTGAADVDAEVEAEVNLLVDLAALVDVGAVVGEARFDLPSSRAA